MSVIFASVWNINTEYDKRRADPQWCERVCQNKLDQLQRVVGLVHKSVIALNGGRAPDLHLFAAPEFLFANHWALKVLGDYGIADFAFDSYQKRRIAACIGTICGKYSNLLLVPGTTFWKETKFRMEEVPTPSGTMVKACGIQDMNPYIQPSSVAPVTSAFPDRDSVSMSTQRTTAEQLEADRKRVLEMIGLERTSLDVAALRNTAILGYDGRIKEYSKMFPDESEYGEQFAVFTPGKQPGKFEFGNFTVGLEICSDHANGALLTNVNEKVDIQVIVSAYVSGEDACRHYVDDGLMVLADTRNPGVYTGNWEELNPVHKHTDGLPGTVNVYRHDR